MAQQNFSLNELSELADVPKRTVRYYIQIGLLERPEGETRGAYYLTSHLDKLLRIRQLTEAGISLERVRDVLRGDPPLLPPRRTEPGSIEVRSHIWIAPGIEIQVTPEQAKVSSEQVRSFAKAVVGLWNQITAGKDEE